jgi:hypothetical protein
LLLLRVRFDGDGLRDAAGGQARLSRCDGVARVGPAPQTVMLIDVNQRAEVAGDAERRARILDRRVANVQRELSRNGIAPANIAEWPGAGLGGVQTYPPGELQAKQMVVIARY